MHAHAHGVQLNMEPLDTVFVVVTWKRPPNGMSKGMLITSTITKSSSHAPRRTP